MWIRRAIYENLVKLAAQSELLTTVLASAEKRAQDAESALQAERAAKDWLTIQLSSRVVTKHGGYGLDHVVPENPVPTTERPFEPSEMDLAKLEFYKKCARQVGKSEEDAQMRWEAEMRGEPMPIESEVEQ